MTNQTIKIHNVETGEIVEREMNAQELKQFEKDQETFIFEKELERNKQAAKTAARAAILDRLGLTVEEAAALLS